MENFPQNDQNAHGKAGVSLPRIFLWIQRGLLVTGLALVAFVCASWLESYFSSRAALKAFNVAEPGRVQWDDSFSSNTVPDSELPERMETTVPAMSREAPSRNARAPGRSRGSSDSSHGSGTERNRFFDPEPWGRPDFGNCATGAGRKPCHCRPSGHLFPRSERPQGRRPDSGEDP